MSDIYHNWERLVAATVKRDQDEQLCYMHSRESSISSDFNDSFSTSSRRSISASSSFDVPEPVKMPAGSQTAPDDDFAVDDPLYYHPSVLQQYINYEAPECGQLQFVDLQSVEPAIGADTEGDNLRNDVPSIKIIYEPRTRTRKLVPERWLIKMKKTIPFGLLDSVSTPPVLAFSAFEVANLMVKLINLWHSLSDKNISSLRNQFKLLGVHKLVSDNVSILSGLARAEFFETLGLAAQSVSHIDKLSNEFSINHFSYSSLFRVGNHDAYWLLNSKEMESAMKKLDQFVMITVTLHREMEKLDVLQNGLNRVLRSDKIDYGDSVKELQQKILRQRREVKYLKERSLWLRSYDTINILLGRIIYTVLDRIKNVFGFDEDAPFHLPRRPLPPIDSGPALVSKFFQLHLENIRKPHSTLGSAALQLHYANVIIMIEKMLKSPYMVSTDDRDDLYAMLPNDIRYALRARLYSKVKSLEITDAQYVNECIEALQGIMGWLLPLAQNTITWHNERHFKHLRSTVSRTNVLLLQTLHFANKNMTEAYITDVLVLFHCIWRFGVGALFN